VSEIRPGDWVRFPRDGHLVVAVVEYVVSDPVSCVRWTLFTDQGSVYERDVLEWRRRPEVSP